MLKACLRFPSLCSAYIVMGLINPNANLDAIISPLHLKIDNLLKKVRDHSLWRN
jgi:hypothetical protein